MPLTIRGLSDEWVLLDNANSQWTVARADVTAAILDVSFTGSCEYRAAKVKTDTVETPAGQFDAMAIQYNQVTDIDEEVTNDYLFTLWLSPGVGIVKMEGRNYTATLSAYHIE